MNGLGVRANHVVAGARTQRLCQRRVGSSDVAGLEKRPGKRVFSKDVVARGDRTFGERDGARHVAPAVREEPCQRGWFVAPQAFGLPVETIGLARAAEG